MNQEGRKGGGEFLINLPCYIYGTLNLSCLYCQQYLARNVYYPDTDTDSRKDHTKPPASLVSRKHFLRVASDCLWCSRETPVLLPGGETLVFNPQVFIDLSALSVWRRTRPAHASCRSRGFKMLSVRVGLVQSSLARRNYELQILQCLHSVNLR